MRPASSLSSWVVGTYDQRTKKAVLTEFESEEEARTAYDDSPNASRVLLLLWPTRRRPPASSAASSRRIRNDEDDDAKEVSDAATKALSLLFHKYKLISCSTAAWDVQGIGVATCLWWLALLQDSGDGSVVSAKAASTADAEIILQRLADGSLPFVPTQRSAWTQQSLKWAMKLVFGRPAVIHFGSAPYRYQSVCHFDMPPATADGTTSATQYVALSMDDAPCRFNDRDCSMVAPIQELLARYQAKATFMLVGQWCTATHQADLVSLLQNGHELANHGMQDRSYEHDPPERFGQAVDQCTAIIQQLQSRAAAAEAAAEEHNNNPTRTTPPWFRAPHGRYTAEMAAQLRQRQMVNVMCDTYASCPILQDGAAVAAQLLSTVQNGSIILLHMPEVPVRQWCWTALELLLEGLVTERGFRVVTIGQLAQLSSNSSSTGTTLLSQQDQQP
jgi:peptidoglycan/xylan/chitin deacetylase (PgdA/CDA1 family)